jgi:hypothetical protein
MSNLQQAEKWGNRVVPFGVTAIAFGLVSFFAPPLLPAASLIQGFVGGVLAIMATITAVASFVAATRAEKYSKLAAKDDAVKSPQPDNSPAVSYQQALEHFGKGNGTAVRARAESTRIIVKLPAILNAPAIMQPQEGADKNGIVAASQLSKVAMQSRRGAVEGNGIVFHNHVEAGKGIWQSAPTDGTACIIFNDATAEQLAKMQEKLQELRPDSTKDLTLEQIDKLFRFATKIGLKDRYNTTVAEIESGYNNPKIDDRNPLSMPAKKGFDTVAMYVPKGTNLIWNPDGKIMDTYKGGSFLTAIKDAAGNIVKLRHSNPDQAEDGTYSVIESGQPVSLTNGAPNVQVFDESYRNQKQGSHVAIICNEGKYAGDNAMIAYLQRNTTDGKLGKLALFGGYTDGQSLVMGLRRELSEELLAPLKDAPNDLASRLKGLLGNPVQHVTSGVARGHSYAGFQMKISEKEMDALVELSNLLDKEHPKYNTTFALKFTAATANQYNPKGEIARVIVGKCSDLKPEQDFHYAHEHKTALAAIKGLSEQSKGAARSM